MKGSDVKEKHQKSQMAHLAAVPGEIYSKI